MSDDGGAVLKAELEAALSSLRNKGAERFDPARFQIITSMSDKALSHRPETARLVRQRALARLNAYQETWQCEQEKIEPLAAQIEKLSPE